MYFIDVHRVEKNLQIKSQYFGISNKFFEKSKYWCASGVNLGANTIPGLHLRLSIKNNITLFEDDT